jgi:CheY-like chemotaxis protein
VEVSEHAEPVPDKIRESSPLFQSMLPAGAVRISVKDSGAGLSPQQLAEICAEGVQFNANELQAGQGSGLGLFISKGIVEQHGGRMVVTSEGLGKGAQFTITLPLFTADVPEGTPRVASGSAEQSDETVHLTRAHTSLSPQASKRLLELPPQRLLVVDDSVLNRKMLVRLLTSKDHTCEQAEDGEVAVRKYLEMVERGEPPDAILMDFEMPVMNGPTATARLRELGCECLIVGVTGNVLAQDVAFFIAHGADKVMPKPVILEDFERVLLQRLNQTHAAASAEDKQKVRKQSGTIDEAKRQMLKLSPSRSMSGNKVYISDETSLGAQV